jgi:uncharacterized protein YrrD
MMYRTKDILYKPVISTKNRKQIGIVKDLYISWEEGKVKSVIIETGSFLTKSQLVYPLNVFKKIAGEWLPLLGREESGDNKKSLDIQNWSEYHGLIIVSNWGHEKGFLEDIFFTFPEGKIEVIEISDGFLKDFIYGRIKVPYKFFEAFTKRMIIVEEDWEVVK